MDNYGWVEVSDQADIENLLSQYGHFHDSCLRDLYITTAEFVDDELSMHFREEITARLLFQRQSRMNSVLELKFVKVNQVNYKPMSNRENYNNLLDDAFLRKIEGLFYWADFKDWEIGDNDSVWISGEKLFWRHRSELLGKVDRIEE